MILKITITAIYMGQRCQNVFYLERPDWVDSMHDSLAQELRDQWVFRVKGQQNVGFQYQNIQVQKWSGTPDVPYLLDITGNTGALAGPGYHPSIAVIFTFRTGIATRKGRGRIYNGGVHGETPLNGVLHPSALGAWSIVAAQLTAIYSLTGSSSFTLQVGPPNTHDQTQFNAVQQIICRPYFGIQRRRNINIGV